MCVGINKAWRNYKIGCVNDAFCTFGYFADCGDLSSGNRHIRSLAWRASTVNDSTVLNENIV
jgi:hypothetical protein